MNSDKESIEETPGEARDRRFRATRLASIIAAVVNACLAVMQVVAGWLFQSQALIADGIHTLSDLVSDAVVLFAATQAAAGPDEDHPYGHGRIETLATIVVGVFLALAGLAIAWSAGQRLLQWETLTGPAPAALAFALLTIIAKESLYQYTVRVARRIGSSLLQANAWHHRSDAFSSLVVLVGIGGAIAGWPWLDALAAFIVAFFILFMAWRLIFPSAAELIDTALDPEQVARIQQSIATVPGVHSVHMLRTRKLGNEAAADVHIQVGSQISVSEGHQIADEVYRAIAATLPNLRDITVHVDPENDEERVTGVRLPLRPEILARLRKVWREEHELEQIEALELHYLAGQVHLNITLHVEEEQTLECLRRRSDRLATDIRALPDWGDQLGQINISYHLCTK